MASVAHSNFKVYQLYVKNAFLNGELEEEVYGQQPSGSENPEFPNFVYKLLKDLYGLKQVPRACYHTLSHFLLDNQFTRGTTDKTLFYKKHGNDIISFKFMWMILFLVLQMRNCAKDFLS